MKFVKSKEGTFMHQQKYMKEMLKIFEMTECKEVTNPSKTNTKLDVCAGEEYINVTFYKQMVGSLRYLCHNKSDICYAVNIERIFMSIPNRSHLIVVKRILRYLKGTLKLDLKLPSGESETIVGLIGYSDVEWCEDKSKRRSRSGYIFLYDEATMSWCTKKQSVTPLSSYETEYIVGSFAL